MSKIVIHAREVAEVFGCTAKTACNKLNAVRAAYNKSPKQPVTIREFCNYFNMDYDEVIKVLDMSAR